MEFKKANPEYQFSSMQFVSPPSVGIWGGCQDKQVGGTHYTSMPIQPRDVMRAVLTRDEYIGYMKGNIIKYAMRAGHKPGSDDAAKADHYREALDAFIKS